MKRMLLFTMDIMLVITGVLGLSTIYFMDGVPILINILDFLIFSWGLLAGISGLWSKRL